MTPPTDSFDAVAHPRARSAPTEPDRILLEGPHSRLKELWLVLGAVRDFIRGFRTFHFLGPCVTVFGSARFDETHEYYALARRVGGALVELGFTVMTGGGPGIMEAANRGAREARGRTVGCNVELPFEQTPNPYLDRWVILRYFFTRKVMLLKYSYAFIVMPGGLGTMDEMFEALTLIQTGKVREFPVVLMGREYWAPALAMIERMAEASTISPEDLDLFFVTDDVDEAMSHIHEHAIVRFGLRAKPVPRRSRLLWE